MTKKKIAVIGGGIGAMSAVWAITSSPDWQEKYDITVYQLGWRLGGKGASGRGPGARIQEHGLHIFMGFYENTFRVLRQVFDELKNEQAVFTSIQDAFLPHSRIGVMENVDDKWTPWIIDFPKREGEPGDGTPRQYTTVWEVMSAAVLLAIDWIKGELETLEKDFPDIVELLHEWEALAKDAGTGRLVSLERICDLHHGSLGEIEEQLRLHMNDAQHRHVLLAIDLAGTVLSAFMWNWPDIAKHGFSVFDDLDFQAFLKKYGARQETYDVKLSAPVRGFYDLVFAYEDGDVERPNLAAGVALRSAICVALLYKNSVFMKMRSAMGDTIFAPFHKALVKRGVKFEFFHRLDDVKLDESSDGKIVGQLIFNRQAWVLNGSYDPYVNVHGLDCWPQAPLTNQLVKGEAILKGPNGDGTDGWDGHWKGYDLENFWTAWPGVETRTLQRGSDFDEVILAVPPAAHRLICPDAVANSANWAKMIDNVGSVQTQAMQLWMKSTVAGLGWREGSTVVDAYREPYNTWADMTDLIDREQWPEDAGLRSIAYFCGAMPGVLPPPHKKGVMEGENQAAAKAGQKWLAEAIGDLWPLAANANGGLKAGQTVDIYKSIGTGLLQGQYWRANASPSERYVLSLTGSTQYRLGADGSGCANLFFAGDWTNNGFNAGCVEAATMSGLRCSQAICGFPSDEEIETYW